MHICLFGEQIYELTVKKLADKNRGLHFFNFSRISVYLYEHFLPLFTHVELAVISVGSVPFHIVHFYFHQISPNH